MPLAPPEQRAMMATASQPASGGPPLISLAAMRDATSTEAVTAFLERTVVASSDWRLDGVRRRYVRLEPPHAYWAMYRVRVSREAGAETETRDLHLVCRGVFDDGFWPRYREGLLRAIEGPCDPLNGRGLAVVDDTHQLGIWFYPVDPQLPSLLRAADPGAVRTVLRRERGRIFDAGDGRLGEVDVTLQRYVPEINATLRYDVELEAGTRSIFAKVARGADAAAADELQRQLYELAQRSEGRLRVVRPRGHHPELGASLQDAASGEPIGGERANDVFQAGALAAAEALSILHEADISTDVELDIERELGRLDAVVDQFALVHPRAKVLLRQLLDRVRRALEWADEEDVVCSHGDLKYDQLIHDGAGFTVIDFEYFGRGETSWDLAKFAAHAVPSMPLDWADSAAAEHARAEFLDRYLELRPAATLTRLPLYEAVHTAERAMVLMWGQRRGWEDAAESLLVLAMERLNTPAP
ncbi:MAG: phosphotransferase family protein [Candidatus Dormibacteria bacterium]